MAAQDPAPAPWRLARSLAAVGPGPGEEPLRTAYLELLKLALCDLAGTGTHSVWQHTDGSLMSRELTGEDLRIRAGGVDWPLHGTTMVGLARLDDLQACLERVLRDGVPGDVLEAGTWRGGAAILMRAVLDAHGAADRTVWVADSFSGFPERAEGEDSDHERLAALGYLAVPLAEVEANFSRYGLDRGVRFVPGFFEETLAGLAGRTWSVLRLDGDTYEATWAALDALYPGLSVGGHLIVDDYGALEECRRAVDEYRARHGIEEPLERIDWTGVRWQRAGGAPIEPGSRPPSVPARRSAAPRPAGPPAPIRSMAERAAWREQREAQRRAAALEQRLAAAEAEIAALRAAPLRALRSWVRARRGR